MSRLTRLISRNAHRVRDEAAETLRHVLANPLGAAAAVADLDRMVERAVSWAARKLGIRLSDDDATWAREEIGRMAFLREAARLRVNAQHLLDDLERWGLVRR